MMEYCQSLKAELEGRRYNGAPVRVRIDIRDMRGGEKVWHHIKRGVPVRVEIGPRDVEAGGVFVGRRDQTPRDKTSMPRAEFVATIADTLDEIQKNLYDRAFAYRQAATVEITDLDEFVAFFTPRDKKKPEIHGGFALSPFVDTPEIDATLAPLKVTARCIPLDQEQRPAKCIFTGEDTTTWAIFAKSY